MKITETLNWQKSTNNSTELMYLQFASTAPFHLLNLFTHQCLFILLQKRGEKAASAAAKHKNFILPKKKFVFYQSKVKQIFSVLGIIRE